MAEKLLTDKALRAARVNPEAMRPRVQAAPGGAPARPRPEYLLADGGSLYARVRLNAQGSGSITWQFFFKWSGKTERLSIGPYPEVSLADARARRDAARRQINMDPPQHPVLEARRRAEASRAQAMADAMERTVRGLFDDWCSVYLAHHRKDAGRSARADFEYDVFPHVGELRARQITRAHISSLVDRVVARGARRKANALLALLKQMFAHGVVRGIVDADPTYGFSKRHAGGRERSRERVLDRGELDALALQLPKAALGDVYQAAVCLLLATGARVGELTKAKWEHVDLGARVWTIPRENAKNGREHRIHLAEFSLAQLAVFAPVREGPYLLAGRDPARHLDHKAIAKALRDRQRAKPLKNRTVRAVGTLRLAGGDWTPHDLRRTFATHLADMGTAPHVVERALNHTMQGVMAVYNRHDYWDERRAALEAWNAQLGKIFAAATVASRAIDHANERRTDEAATLTH